MIIEYRGKSYSITITNRYECAEIIDCEIEFKNEVSKHNFLNRYFNRPDFSHGDKSKIDNIIYNKCYFYDKEDSKISVKCHIDKREGLNGRQN
jgi:hypothetical protein